MGCGALIRTVGAALVMVALGACAGGPAQEPPAAPGVSVSGTAEIGVTTTFRH